MPASAAGAGVQGADRVRAAGLRPNRAARGIAAVAPGRLANARTWRFAVESGMRFPRRIIVRSAAQSGRSVVNDQKNAQAPARAQGFLTKSCVVPESD
ncbi:hypothetical protein [Burkholderia thailandensis]|uniref:Integral membrane protein n=2 Tax=Burkholderia thailandensis TaxID=57975 RepID=Q2T488_BURTA|nr:hypothetical protein [Burkholderia thailandensis]ABC34210.1 putative integral membrane protein [Burkholderia thailandensis E264]AOJ48652.1 hypothetical protein WJ27_26735 [Burkholderia thailandensis]AWY60781.1 hypothetical protein A8H35_20850 [Burkholderia thailandensis]KVG12211.1 hypothetical protein WJ25_07255 [Burkholderia thailandensis]KVG19077.1 hypothetical protein WJ28_05850 [Burkholderia thailandensis]